MYLEFDKTNVLKQGVLTSFENKKNYVIEQVYLTNFKIYLFLFSSSSILASIIIIK